mmetsp:Transcript_12466/g.31484  ORF Transcript_12466/g.31484 Transcript_12466/m.31484 type:complete len:218 (+) Transcript_12466:596-1249(+)
MQSNAHGSLQEGACPSVNNASLVNSAPRLAESMKYKPLLPLQWNPTVQAAESLTVSKIVVGAGLKKGITGDKTGWINDGSRAVDYPSRNLPGGLPARAPSKCPPKKINLFSPRKSWRSQPSPGILMIPSQKKNRRPDTGIFIEVIEFFRSSKLMREIFKRVHEAHAKRIQPPTVPFVPEVENLSRSHVYSFHLLHLASRRARHCSGPTIMIHIPRAF